MLKRIFFLFFFLFACSTPQIQEVQHMPLTLTSPAFTHNHEMPARYTCQGDDISPPLHIANVPAATESLVLIMDDPDAPDPAAPKMTWDHWVVWNIAPTTTTISEGKAPTGAIVGQNSWPKNTYGGPCPPIGTHRYFFKLYALNTTLTLRTTATKKEVERAMQHHIIEKTELVGRYKKR